MDVSTKGLVVQNPNATRTFELDALNRAIENIEQILAHRKAGSGAKSDQLYYELMVKYLRNYRDAKVSGKPLAYGAVSGSGWPALLKAMDIVPYSSTPISVAIAQTQGLQQEVLDGATDAGLPTYTCTSVARFAWGGVVRGFMAPPDLIIGNSIYCTTMATGLEFWAHWLGVPYYRLDRPHLYSEEAISFYKMDLENLVRWLEQQTGHKMDWDKLAQNVEYLRQLVELRKEIAELRKSVPHPMRSRVCCHLELIDFYWAGAPEAVEFYSQVLAEIKERAAQKRGFVEKERFRLLCMYLPPTHAQKILDWWERQWGAVSVMEPWFSFCPRNVELDTKKPLESLARFHFYGRYATYFGLSGHETVQDFVSFAKDYAVDGAVWYSSHTCQESNVIIQMVKDALKKQARVPMLVVDADYVDPTYLSEAEMRDKTEPFFEMLAETKGA